MSRQFKGEELFFEVSRKLKKAKNINELRVLQSVLFPLRYKMSLKETSEAVGMSPRWVSNARNKYIKHQTISVSKKSETRNRANLTLEEERVFLSSYFKGSQQGGLLLVKEMHKELEKRLGKKITLQSVYNMLHRHGWRKLVPDKRHILADQAKQEEWKKNFLKKL